MVDPIRDKTSGKLTFPKPEPGAATTPADMAYIAIPRGVMTQLAGLAKQDGFKTTAETPKGQQNQTSKACRSYILMAVDMLLDKRGVK